MHIHLAFGLARLLLISGAMTSREDREKFRRIIRASELPIAIFGEWVMGVDRKTAQRYLHEGEIPRSKLIWMRHVQSVTHSGDEVTIVMRWNHANRRWWPYVEERPRTHARDVRGFLERSDYKKSDGKREPKK